MGHPWLQPVNPDQGEMRSDADLATTGVVEMGSGQMMHIPAPGSLASQMNLGPMPLTTATTSGTAATRDAQAYNSYGAAPEGPHKLTEVRNNQ
jgi:hypothetical protein